MEVVLVFVGLLVGLVGRLVGRVVLEGVVGFGVMVGIMGLIVIEGIECWCGVIMNRIIIELNIMVEMM